MPVPHLPLGLILAEGKFFRVNLHAEEAFMKTHEPLLLPNRPLTLQDNCELPFATLNEVCNPKQLNVEKCPTNRLPEVIYVIDIVGQTWHPLFAGNPLSFEQEKMILVKQWSLQPQEIRVTQLWNTQAPPVPKHPPCFREKTFVILKRRTLKLPLQPIPFYTQACTIR